MIKLPVQTRFRILMRDQNKCVNCSKSAEEGVQLKIEHITPLAAGGTNNIHNLHTLCIECVERRPLSIRRVFSPLSVQNRIPAEYAIGMLQQALKKMRSDYGKGELSYEEAFIAVNKKEFVSGINPLFFPMPKNAFIAAALVLGEEGKLKVEGKMIKI